MMTGCVTQGAEASVSEARGAALLLSFAAEAILEVRPDLRGGAVFSPECTALFGRSPAGVDIGELLAPDDWDMRCALRQCLSDSLAESEGDRSQLFLDLLPEVLTLGARRVQLKVHRVMDGLVLVLTDRSDQEDWVRQIQRQKQLLEMVRTVVCERPSWDAAIAEYVAFLDAGPEAWNERSALVRRLHTMKGTFAQLGFYFLPTVLHAAESALSRVAKDAMSMEDVRATVFTDALVEAFEDDRAALHEILGEAVDDAPGGVWLPAAAVQRIEAWALAQPIRAVGTEPVLRRLMHLSSVSLHAVLRGYERMMQNLAEKLGKALAPLVIEGPDILFRETWHRAWLTALGHVFRNAIDHGVESPTLRRALGKPSAGRVTCRVTVSGAGPWTLEIEDDGAGISEAAVREHVVAAGLEPEQRCMAEWIFVEGISSRDHVTEVSGRGVGLAAMREAMESLGGTIEAWTEAGRGTRIRIVLPQTNAEILHEECDDDLGW